MTHLGSFGEAHELADLTFDYFGQTLHGNPELSDLDYVEFLGTAGGIDINDLSSLGLVKDFARMCVAESDFDEFWRLARKNRQKVEDVFKVLTAIVEATVDRPTGQPSDSADGHGSTAQNSEAGDFSRAMTQLEGRPDLQLFVTRQQEAV